MFDELDMTRPANDKAAFELLSELERNTPEEVRQQRSHFRISLKAKVILEPGSSSEMLKLRLQGVTGDISEGGCCALFPMPVHVGDVYRLTFDRSVFDQPLMFVRCVRCRLLREDAFEAGFQFFAPIQLPANLHSAAGLA